MADVDLKFEFRARVDWRKGKRLTAETLRETRFQFLLDVAQEAARLTPHERFVDPDVMKFHLSEVVFTHPGAIVAEFGADPHFPPVSRIMKWVEEVGKEPAAAYRIIQQIGREGIKARPFLREAFERAVRKVPAHARRIWLQKGG